MAVSPLHAQLYRPSTTSEVQYPDAAMTPSSYNLDVSNTKYLSNHSLPGAGAWAGSILEVAGWSTDRDGGFSYGISTSGAYTGSGAVALPNAMDVQVGIIIGGPDYYIVAAYYDPSISHYCYSLFKWDLNLGTCAFLYKYKFIRPNSPQPDYIDNTLSTAGYAHTSPPLPDFPPLTMLYDRISMDIDKDGQKIAFVMGDANDGRMYTTVGFAATDTLLLCPNLPRTNVHPHAILTIPPPTVDPLYIVTAVPPYTGWTPIAGGAYDIYDAASGQYVRYFSTGPLAGKYHYSYYPIDDNIFVTEYDGSTCTELPTSQDFYNPLIGLKACSWLHTPGYNPQYHQRWADVAFGFSGSPDNKSIMSYVFYVDEPNIADLYVATYTSFDDYYNCIGSPGGGWPVQYPNEILLRSSNTIDGYSLSSDYGFGAGAGHSIFITESSNITLPTSTPIRAKIDMPDNDVKWAVTFAYSPSSSIFPPLGLPDFYDPLLYIHYPTDYDLNNIYVRTANPRQIILNNNSLVDTSGLPRMAENGSFAHSPTISWNASGTRYAVAWVSERAGIFNSIPAGYAAVKVTHGSSATKVSIARDYLYVSNDPTLRCGDNPLISLSKHAHGLNDIYSAFGQEDNSSVYSVVHKDHSWNSAPNTWKIGKEGSEETNINISVTPNPFTREFVVSFTGTATVTIVDALGRTLYSKNGEASLVNSYMKENCGSLSPGMYFLRVKDEKGNSKSIKLTKL